ncbi:MAG: amino acid adenylation domain-containing protein [Acidobacteria bacterium]|nr:amino acid adenylation domain-containing protein [Acidobacteriota bacterium]
MMSKMIFTTKLKEEQKYWIERLSRKIDESNLPLDYKRSNVYSDKRDKVETRFYGEIYQKLERLTDGSALLIYTTAIAALKLCLYKYTGNTSIVVGSPAYKHDPDFDQQNALAIVNEVDPRMSFRTLLLGIRQVLIEAYARQSYPFNSIIDDLSLKAENKCPLFDVAILLKEFHTELPSVKNDITITLARAANELAVTIEFTPRLFRRERIELFLKHFEKALSEGLSHSDATICELNLLSEDERIQLVKWNDTGLDHSQPPGIHLYFEAQAERTPDAVAAVFVGENLTYGELSRRAAKLACYLQKLGVEADVRVGLYFERSLELVIGILGILKAGGAYVPLDPAYPAERLNFMLKDADVPILLLQERLKSSLPEYDGEVLYLDADQSTIRMNEREWKNPTSSPDQLAYVLYTSGSTGRPKGVAMNHCSLTNLIAWQLNVPSFQAGARTLQFAPSSFDVSFQEIFSTWCSGGTLVLVPKDVRQDLYQLLYFLLEESIERVFLPFVALQQLAVVCGLQQRYPKALREVITAGEQLQVTEPLIKMFRQLERCSLHNQYGPTESHVVTAFLLNQTATRWSHQPPIGRPIHNTQMRLLDQCQLPTLLGAAGELHIGGSGLARCYLNRPDLTAEKFIPDPSGLEAGARIYKTGDLARYLYDGDLEFLGRADHQVKIRGFRIELGEIETALAQHLGVKESLVIARRDQAGDQRLVAYLVTLPTAVPTVSELRRFLSEKLPEYMVPSSFVVLEQLPLTPTGKVDRRALPAPNLTEQALEKNFLSPQTWPEEILANVWREVLRVKRVGIHDNFFELGGDSILALQIITRANQAGLQLVPKQLFQHQTIAELAAVANQIKSVRTEQITVSGSVLLTPIQIWALEQSQPVEQWRMAVLLEMRKKPNLYLLEQVVHGLIEHHDAFRLRLVREGSNWRQFIASIEENAVFSIIDISALPVSEHMTAIRSTVAELRRSLNLARGPIIRFALFNPGSNLAWRLYIVVHHFAIDGVSWRILLEDFQTACQQLSLGEDLKLLPKTTSIKQWAEILWQMAELSETEQEIDYWLSEKRRLVRPLPVDYPDGANTLVSTCEIWVSLEVDETKALLQAVPKTYHTQINDILLTALAHTFTRWSGDRILLVDLEGHGREEIVGGLDLSRTVGWFAAIFPVLLELTGATSLSEELKSVKDHLRQIPNRGIKYGWLRYLSQKAPIAEAFASFPPAQVRFNYLGQFDQVVSESSLFKLAPETIGRDWALCGDRKYLLEVDGLITDNQVKFLWRFSENLYRRTTVEYLAFGFVEAIRTLIANCRDTDEPGFALLDFPLAQLDHGELDKVFAQVQFDGV